MYWFNSISDKYLHESVKINSQSSVVKSSYEASWLEWGRLPLRFQQCYATANQLAQVSPVLCMSFHLGKAKMLLPRILKSSTKNYFVIIAYLNYYYCCFYYYRCYCCCCCCDYSYHLNKPSFVQEKDRFNICKFFGMNIIYICWYLHIIFISFYFIFYNFYNSIPLYKFWYLTNV